MMWWVVEWPAVGILDKWGKLSHLMLHNCKGIMGAEKYKLFERSLEIQLKISLYFSKQIFLKYYK